MKCTFLALFVLAVAYVNAVSLSVPIQSTVWSFGKKWTAKWVQDTTGKTPNEGSATLYLFHIGNADPTTFQGNDPVLTVQVPDLKSGSADIDLTTVPTAKYPPESYYFIRIGDVSGSYSGKFKITGGTGAAAAPVSSKVSSLGGGVKTSAVGGGFGTSKVSTSGYKTSTKTKKTSNATSDATTLSFSVMAIVAAFIAVFM